MSWKADIMSSYYIAITYFSMYHLSQCRISLKGQRSTVPGRTNISHLGKFGTSSNSKVPFLVGDMWSFPGGYQYTWYYLFFWTSKPLPLRFPNLVENYLLSCSPFETSAIHFTTDSQGCARLEPTLQPPVITVETTCRYRSVRAFKSKIWRW